MASSIYIGGKPKGETPILDRREKDRLLALGLTERDLAFMGEKQRDMVQEVLSAKA